MRLEVSRKSLEGSLAIINAFYRGEKLDSPHTAILRNDESGSYISVESHISSASVPLVTNPSTIGKLHIAFDELQTALNMLSDSELKFESEDNLITISDSNGSLKIHEAASDPIEQEQQELTEVLKSSLRIITPTFKRALNFLPGSTPDFNAIYICDAEDGMRGIVLEPRRFLVMNLESIILLNDVVKIPTRIIAMIVALSNLDKMDIPITISESINAETQSRYLEVKLFGAKQFKFTLQDKSQPPELLSKAKIIEQLVELPLSVEVNREEAITTFNQLQKLVSKDQDAFVSLQATSLGLEMVADPKSMTGIFTKKLPAVNSSFEMEQSIKLFISPKQIVDALKCFTDETANFKFSEVTTSPLGISSQYDDSASAYIARYEM